MRPELPPSNELPKPADPALELAWRGLSISIKGSGMTREQAEAMLASWDKKEADDEARENTL